MNSAKLVTGAGDPEVSPITTAHPSTPSVIVNASPRDDRTGFVLTTRLGSL